MPALTLLLRLSLSPMHCGGGGVDRHAELTKEMLGNAAEMAAGTHWSQLSFKTVNLQVLPCNLALPIPRATLEA